ncbi:hypothetical protein BC936DRAFT_139235 [Jimgerdemannia flammicorona]|uniref:Uncharacterized protein n=1 Tax=Jimgerdemannia flammicorona TaxID=994334 RepID=A0A433BAD3_9FUNG|nr:hypothetical protein BC936DRAFT_139235 [Jimgerdemannia flammicorona]
MVIKPYLPEQKSFSLNLSSWSDTVVSSQQQAKEAATRQTIARKKAHFYETSELTANLGLSDTALPLPVNGAGGVDNYYTTLLFQGELALEPESLSKTTTRGKLMQTHHQAAESAESAESSMAEPSRAESEEWLTSLQPSIFSLGKRPTIQSKTGKNIRIKPYEGLSLFTHHYIHPTYPHPGIILVPTAVLTAAQHDQHHNQAQQKPSTTGRPKASAWTPEEDQFLHFLVQYCGEKTEPWSYIAACIPGRTTESCRERWFRQLAHAVWAEDMNSANNPDRNGADDRHTKRQCRSSVSSEGPLEKYEACRNFIQTRSSGERWEMDKLVAHPESDGTAIREDITSGDEYMPLLDSSAASSPILDSGEMISTDLSIYRDFLDDLYFVWYPNQTSLSVPAEHSSRGKLKIEDSSDSLDPLAGYAVSPEKNGVFF